MSGKKLIGLYGGAFDPVHNAHIEIAKHCIDEIGLNKLILIPTGKSAFKKSLTLAKHRVAMLELAFNKPNYEVSEIEVENSKNSENTSYSFDTLKYFYNKDKNSYFMIIGTDAFANFHQWFKWKDILSLCHILLINRSDSHIFSQKWHPTIEKLIDTHWTDQIKNLKSNRTGSIYSVPMKKIDVASHRIKDCIRYKEDLSQMISSDIENYINKNSLY
jgi:nicotinate-nucleotide adenylyltransferase|tara:strand:- start:1456 stop:2106 length:651 start_codon:yes stop_codon:yes gene_type:complete